MEKFNLRSSFWNIGAIRKCECWITEVIDSEYVNRVGIILWGPNIDSMSNEWSRKVVQGQSGYGLGLLLVRLTEDVRIDVSRADVGCLITSGSITIRVPRSKAYDSSSLAILTRSVSEGRIYSNFNWERLGVGDHQ